MTRTARTLVLAAIASASPIVAPGAAAQRGPTVMLEVGSSQIGDGNGWRATAVSLNPSIRVDARAAFLTANAGLVRYDATWSTHGSLAGSLFTRVDRPLGIELLGVASGGRHRTTWSTGEGRATARVHARARTAGVWAGGGAGAGHDGDSTRALRLLDSGGWVTVGSGIATVSITPVKAGSEPYYTSVEAAFWVPHRSVDLSVSAGSLSAPRTAAYEKRAWANVGAVIWVRDRIGVAVGAGSHGPNPVQRLAGGNFITAAVRLANRRSHVPADHLGTPAGPLRALPSPTLSDFQLVRSGSRATLRVRAPGARLVEVSGDFTLWEPVRLTPAGAGWWVVTLPIQPGIHELNVRLDGGSWLVPPGLAVVNDRLGGASGRLEIH